MPTEFVEGDQVYWGPYSSIYIVKAIRKDAVWIGELFSDKHISSNHIVHKDRLKLVKPRSYLEGDIVKLVNLPY